MLDPSPAPDWMEAHRRKRPPAGIWRSRARTHVDTQKLLSDKGFNNHATNDGRHVSPYDEGKVLYGLDGLEVRLLQDIDEKALKRTLSRALRATTGVHPDEPVRDEDSDEMFRGGLQAALETQTIVFEVIGASRALTHQLVRSRRAGFHQQSQRATWFGDRPNVRRPMSVLAKRQSRSGPDLDAAWDRALLSCWEAYKMACDAGVSYQDARYILPEGTTNYILCEYTIREFINVFAYRGCSMFLWEMVGCMREMRRVLLEAHPFLEPYVKISCEKGDLCRMCKGSGYTWNDGIAADESEVERHRADLEYPARALSSNHRMIHECLACDGKGSPVRKCTFQGWENVEKACDFPWAKQSNRVFLPNPSNRIGG